MRCVFCCAATVAPLFVLPALPSCAAVLTTAAASSMYETSELRNRLSVNVWSDEAEVFNRTQLLVKGGYREDPSGHWLGLTAPAWSYDGLSIRVAALISGNVVDPPGLLVSVLSESGVTLRLYADGTEIKCDGTSEHAWPLPWRRFALAHAIQEKARTKGLQVRVECVGSREWTFDLAPTYFQGFERRAVEKAGIEKLVLSSAYHP